MKRTRIGKLITVLLCCVLVLASVPIAGQAAGSFSGSGKGTRANPYIITNAQQLDEMRNNLKAYYKLGDTVDMSAVKNFKPIGSIAEPFTGSFTCDANADGTPKYIIKNLTIVNTPVGATLAEGYSGYKDDGTSGWETALFGCANGSTFKNIVVLDANIKSTVEGRSGMNSDWSLNPGMDDQPTAVLLGIGTNVTVTGCGASGKIESASNGTGGLISVVEGNSVVSHSYSYVDITCTGAWNSGGFIANVGVGSEVKFCFYDGNFRGGATEDGAFFGVASGNWDKQDNPGKVHDCWAAGTVLDESSGCFGGAQGFSDYATRIDPYTYVYNTYTLAVIEGRTKAQTNKKVTNNNYIHDQPGGFEIGYAAASQEDINAAFKGLSGWVVKDGTYPQIQGLTPVKDAAAYVPGAEAQPTEAPTTKPTEAPTTKPTEAPTAVPTQDTAAPTQGTEAPTEGTQPTETAKPTEGTKPTETEKPTEGSPTETAKPTEGSPTETAKPTEDKPTETTKPAEETPTETGATQLPTEEPTRSTEPEETVGGEATEDGTNGESQPTASSPEQPEDPQILTAEMRERIAAMTASERTLTVVLVVIFAAALACFAYTIVCMVIFLKKKRTHDSEQ